MDEFFAGLSGFIGDWGWLFALIFVIVAVLAIGWFIFVASMAAGMFRSTRKAFKEDRW